MSVWLIVGWSCFGIAALVIAYLVIVLRGAMKTTEIDPEFDPKVLTGREREEIRRKIVNLGPAAVSSDDVLNLLYTFRMIELGEYTDEDVYVPEDPYGDV